MKNLWCRPDISLKLTGSVYHTAIRSVLLRGCKTWSLCAENVRRCDLLDHRRLRGWSERVDNALARNRVLGAGWENFLSQRIHLDRLRWMDHMLRIANSRLPYCVLILLPPTEWKELREGRQRERKRRQQAVYSGDRAITHRRIEMITKKCVTTFGLHSVC